MHRFITALFIATACGSIAEANAAQAHVLPYGLDPTLDLPITAGLLAMQYPSGALLQDMRERPRDIAALNPNDIPSFDRWAIGFYSPRLSAMSSVVAGAE